MVCGTREAWKSVIVLIDYGLSGPDVNVVNEYTFEPVTPLHYIADGGFDSLSVKVVGMGDRLSMGGGF